jgi:bifunctional DNA-binding transcriptional regulator/antitoxin component of YhaV-PrlF toxin-antitoxin module
MKAYEFAAAVSRTGGLTVPKSILRALPPSPKLRVMILVREPQDESDEADWSRLTEQEFLRGYGEADSVYDKA